MLRLVFVGAFDTPPEGRISSGLLNIFPIFDAFGLKFTLVIASFGLVSSLEEEGFGLLNKGFLAKAEVFDFFNISFEDSIPESDAITCLGCFGTVEVLFLLTILDSEFCVFTVKAVIEFGLGLIVLISSDVLFSSFLIICGSFSFIFVSVSFMIGSLMSCTSTMHEQQMV